MEKNVSLDSERIHLDCQIVLIVTELVTRSCRIKHAYCAAGQVGKRAAWLREYSKPKAPEQRRVRIQGHGDAKHGNNVLS